MYRYAFLDELKSLLEKARSYYPQEEIERLTMRRNGQDVLENLYEKDKNMSMEELAGYVCSQLENVDIYPTIGYNRLK